MNIYWPKLLGGPGNTKSVPTDAWEDEFYSFVRAGASEPPLYQRREYRIEGDTHVVWAPVNIDDVAVRTILDWHRSFLDTHAFESQRALLADTMEKAMQYMKAILVLGYAGLFTFWSQMKDVFTPATVLSSALLILLSVAGFVGWEIYGMVVRSKMMMSIANAVKEQSRYKSLIVAHKERQIVEAARLAKVWPVCLAVIAGCAVFAAAIMGSAFIHGIWHEFS